jgi:hypothetical protein
MVWQKGEVASLQTGTTQRNECTGARTATGKWKERAAAALSRVERGLRVDERQKEYYF